MRRSFPSAVAAFAGIVLLGCGRSDVANAQTGGGGGASAKPADLVKLSSFGMAGSCAIAVGADGTIHAAFSDAKASGKPAFLYYRASKDDGATWSEPKLVSDDESTLSAGHCRVLVDGRGRVYAIWKYVGVNELLEGPGGPATGILAWRVLENGAWSRPRTLGDEHKPMTSWFAALDGKGQVNVVYSRADDAVDWKGRGMMSYQANNTDQVVLDGAGEPTVTRLIVARHVLTQAEQEAMKAAGKYPAYEDTVPRYDGLWNLNGYVADDGRARFLAEKYPASGEKQSILRFDGQQAKVYHEYKGHLGYNTFSSPPVLLRGAGGTEVVLRRPEAAESEVLRAYVVEDGKPGEKTDVIALADAPKAKVAAWWAGPLAGGRIAAMASVNPQRGVWDATDLLLSIGDGKGNWSAPVNVTDNEARARFAANNGVSSSTSFRPTYAEAATLRDGSVGVVLLNAEKTITGLSTVGITDGGRAVAGVSSFSSESPYVSFTKVKPQ